MIERPIYLNRLKLFKGKQLIKVITGIRRCGKSVLLELYRKYLLSAGVLPRQIQSYNFEEFANDGLRDAAKLHEHILSHVVKGRKNYIFLDEIQNVPQFQRAVDSLYVRRDFDIYITGSNSNLLSGELATLLSGRYVEIQMLPLSFKEYVSAHKDKSNLPKLYQSYIMESSFPYTITMKGQQAIDVYLKGILDSIVIKDIVSRHRITATEDLYRIIRFLFDNIGSIVSIKKISDAMTSAGYGISVPTVEKYVSALVECFVLYPVSRYDIKGKQYLQSGQKYYMADIGLRRAMLEKQLSDTGRMLENIVYLELARRGYKVFTGRSDEREVDFVALNSDGTEYYQVSQTVLAEETLQRELAPLRKIKDNYPKFLLTMDYLPVSSYNGIKPLNVFEWLVDI